MNKDDFTTIIKSSVEDVWHGRRSMNPVEEQTNLLVEKLWPVFTENENTEKIQKIQNEIKNWSDGTFGKYRTALPMAFHLKKEIDELIDALDNEYSGAYFNSELTEIGFQEMKKKQRRIVFELADCLMLIIDCAAHVPLTMNEVCSAVEEKLEINKKRKWGTPDKNGVVEHIQE